MRPLLDFGFFSLRRRFFIRFSFVFSLFFVAFFAPCSLLLAPYAFLFASFSFSFVRFSSLYARFPCFLASLLPSLLMIYLSFASMFLSSLLLCFFASLRPCFPFFLIFCRFFAVFLFSSSRVYTVIVIEELSGAKKRRMSVLVWKVFIGAPTSP